MKQTFTFLLVALWLISLPSLGQQKSAKHYTASVGKATTLLPQQLKRRNDEIKFQATTKIRKDLEDLFNTLTFDGIGDAERNSVIQNSFLPNPNQVFYGDDVVIEDDIDPTHTSAENAVDLNVERYLRNMDLFYVKSDTNTIKFSQIIVSDVQEGKDFPYIKVYFTTKFNGKHNQINTAYQAVQRVAELRAELIDNKWQTFITRLAFLQPGEALTQLSKPIINRDFGPKNPVKGATRVFQRAGNTVDSVIVKWDKQWLQVVHSTNSLLAIGSYQRSEAGKVSQEQISITLKNKDQHLTYRRIDGSLLEFSRLEDPGELARLKRKYRLGGWLQIAAGLAALGSSYAGYTRLQTSYKNYSDQLTTLNAEYAIWQTLTQQAGGTPTAPMSFTTYARPGIYAVYGGVAGGGGLLVNGIRHLIKAGKIKARIR